MLFPTFGTYLVFLKLSGDGEIRTLDPLLARQVLSQLSYTPMWQKDFRSSFHSENTVSDTL